MQFLRNIHAVLILSISFGVLAQDNNRFFSDDSSTTYDNNGQFIDGASKVDNQGAPRVKVNAFELVNFIEDPEFGIELSDIKSLIKKDIDDRRGLYRVSDFQDLTQDITNYYRNNGWVLAKAYIPEQRIISGSVAIHFISGVLSEVEIKNNDFYSEDTLKTPFNDLVGEPINSFRLQTAIMRFSDIPGVSVANSLAPGNEFGSTKLILDVRDEDPLDLYAGIDNYGKESTGQNRVFAGGSINNPLRQADRLWGHFSASYFPTSAVNGEVHYQVPLDVYRSLFNQNWLYDTDFHFLYKSSSFKVTEDDDLKALGFEGSSSTFQSEILKDIKRENQNRLTGKASLAFKESETTTNGTNQSDANLTVLEFGVDYSSADRFLDGGRNVFSTSLHFGIPGFMGSMDDEYENSGRRNIADDEYAGGDFTKLSFQAQRLQSFNDQFLSIRLNGQFTQDMLVSLEQYSIGGQQSVRGYPVGDQVGDSGIYFGLEYIGYSYASKLSLPITDLKLAAFFDVADGRLNGANKNDTENLSAMSVGTYGSFKFAEQYQMRVDLGVPIGKEPSDDTNFSILFNLSRGF